MRHSPESSPCLAAGTAALRRFRCVNAVKPDALGPNPECVTVGDRRPPEMPALAAPAATRTRGGGERQHEPLEKTSEAGRRPGRRCSGRRVARPSIGRHGGSYERSKLVGPGLSRGA